VNQSPVNQSPVNQLSLNAIAAANAPVNQSPVNQLPVNQLPVNQSVIDCSGSFNCATGTLKDAWAAGAIRPGATLGDLRRALAARTSPPNDLPDTWTIADLQDFGNLIVGDLLASLPQPNTLTLADVLALALFANNPETFAFETLNIFDTGLSRYADPLGDAPYTVDFTLTPDGGPTGGSSAVDVSGSGRSVTTCTSPIATGPPTCSTTSCQIPVTRSRMPGIQSQPSVQKNVGPSKSIAPPLGPAPAESDSSCGMPGWGTGETRTTSALGCPARTTAETSKTPRRKAPRISPRRAPLSHTSAA